MNFVFIRYVYTYLFIIHKSSIEDVHHNTTMKSRNAIFFKDVFLFKEAKKKKLFT